MCAASRQAKGYVYGSLESTASLTDVLTLKVDILRASAVLPTEAISGVFILCR